MNKIEFRIERMKEDIARWEVKTKTEQSDFSVGMYKGMIFATEIAIKDLERMLEREMSA